MTRPPYIPADEYPARWRRVQQLMAQNDLELVLACADDRATFGAAHTRWLASFPVHFEPACRVLAREGQPILRCGPATDPYALFAGTIPDVRVLREFTHPDEDYPFAHIQGLAEVAADLVRNPDAVSIAVRRIGLAGRRLMCCSVLSALQHALPGVEWVDLETAMCNLRARKSPVEPAVIRHACQIAQTGFDAAVASGVTERAIMAKAETAMRCAGAEGTGIDTIAAAGPDARPLLARSTFRTVAADDVVLLRIAPRYEGCHAAIGRPVLVGNPSAEVRRALDVAVEAQQAGFAALRSAVAGRAVEAAGLGGCFLYSGVHSVGVIGFKPPIFGPSSGALVEPDRVSRWIFPCSMRRGAGCGWRMAAG